MDDALVNIAYLGQLLDATPKEKHNDLLTALAKMIQFYSDQAEQNLGNEVDHRVAVVKGFYKAVDKSLKKIPASVMSQVKCTKGCAHCCKIKVFVSLAEAQYVYSFCKENKIPIDVTYLKAQAKLVEPEDYAHSPFRNCMFLGEDNSCLVYKARPISCRRYFVTSDPKLCDYRDGKLKQVTYVATIEADMAGAGLIAGDTESGSFPEMLLRAIELDKK